MEQAVVRKHQAGGTYVKDIVYGANDGIITTFAVVAGVAGAGLDSTIVVLLGVANLLADGFSMAASNYLGSKSERDYVMMERRTEELEYHHEPEEERAEMFGFLRQKGYTKKDSDALLPLLSKNKEFWLDIMIREELGICPPEKGGQSVRSAAATFFAFVLAGIIPLMPYILAIYDDVFGVAVISTALTLFIIGTLRSLFTDQPWYIAGAEMFSVGGIAAVIAYGVGFFVSTIV
ncbi:MAG: hypothetical protein A3J54_02985 [Candidatus Ryanbacteria bacterium RIFCSPHIGHO2_02_FULL_45_13b]|uniref:GMP synthase n=1 Tax=Candidatus Ryanbacteria bacterium RIFCSPHIGHO2_02_FULL_45_13b TaxID=1802117 RepID=A0A1G2G6X7_9BACT|nr:MAG: hypothetical protein A3J54_02985 [Candidatus Ryanbacteria bacterium RIFCSPHIGHO2_02_FULL_45_13b]